MATATIDQLGSLAGIDYDVSGSDVQTAVAAVAAGKATLPQYVAWSKLRDDYIGSVARKAAQSRELKVTHSDKGYVMFRGIRGGQYPVGMYPQEWVGVAENLPAVLDYLTQHTLTLDKLSVDKEGKKDRTIDTVRLAALVKRYAAK